jgi:hypothetical protein
VPFLLGGRPFFLALVAQVLPWRRINGGGARGTRRTCGVWRNSSTKESGRLVSGDTGFYVSPPPWCADRRIRSGSFRALQHAAFGGASLPLLGDVPPFLCTETSKSEGASSSTEATRAGENLLRDRKQRRVSSPALQGEARGPFGRREGVPAQLGSWRPPRPKRQGALAGIWACGESIMEGTLAESQSCCLGDACLFLLVPPRAAARRIASGKDTSG